MHSLDEPYRDPALWRLLPGTAETRPVAAQRGYRPPPARRRSATARAPPQAPPGGWLQAPALGTAPRAAPAAGGTPERGGGHPGVGEGGHDTPERVPAGPRAGRLVEARLRRRSCSSTWAVPRPRRCKNEVINSLLYCRNTRPGCAVNTARRHSARRMLVLKYTNSRLLSTQGSVRGYRKLHGSKVCLLIPSYFLN